MKNRLYHHVVEQPFVFATGLAALVHSTWSLGTLFSGQQPVAGLTVEFAGWIIPAFLIAFAMDVGQIVTSAEIRAGNRTRAKYATFAVFAVSTFYLQWLYMAHHMPALQLASGVRDQWSGFATLIRDAAVWIIPAFLPLSTLMYTFSSDHENPVTASESPVMPLIQVEQPVQDLHKLPVVKNAELPATVEHEPMLQPLKHEDEPESIYIAKCEACGWEKPYDNARSSRAALSTHLARYCKAIHLEEAPVYTNGHNHED